MLALVHGDEQARTLTATPLEVGADPITGFTVRVDTSSLLTK